MSTDTLVQEQVHADEEKAGLRIIRLRVDGLPLEGIARSYFAADRIVSQWHARFDSERVCEYEIVHVDGNTLQGRFRLGSPGAPRPSLARVVRHQAERSRTPSGTPEFLNASDAPSLPTLVRRRIRLPAYRTGSAGKG